MTAEKVDPIILGISASHPKAAKLEVPQRKLSSGEDSPTPLGLLKGVGKGSPRNPAAR